MSSNIFDQEPFKEPFAEPVAVQAPAKQRSGLASFIAGTATLAFLAVAVPLYIHVLVKIAIWSWNLI